MFRKTAWRLRQRQFAQWHRQLVIVVACLMLALLSIAPLSAHGGGVPQLTDKAAGPYRIFAWTQPDPLRVGDIHLSIGVVTAAKNTAGLDDAVTDATVTVSLAPTTGETAPIRVTALLQEQLGSYYYEADATLPTAGEWRFTIEVSGAPGDGSAAFVSEVLSARQTNWLLLSVAALLLVGLLGLIGLWNRMQRNTATD